MFTSRDKELISAYLDDEVPEPWKSRLPQFIENAEYRQKVQQRYAAVREALQQANPESVDAAQDRVWNALQQRLPGQISGGHRDTKSRTVDFSYIHPPNGEIDSMGGSWWKRKIRLPIPAAAAIAVALIGFSMAALLLPGRSNRIQDYSTMPEISTLPFSAQQDSIQPVGEGSNDPRFDQDMQFDSDMQLRVQVSSIDQLLELLSNQNVVRDVTIDLPPESNFSIHGEPALLRASEIGLQEDR